MSDQIAFEGMPEKLFPITPSKLDTWLSCPRKYRYQYVDYPKPPKGGPRAVTTMGISIHNALKDWFRLETQQRTSAAAESLLRAAWRDDGFRDEEQSLGALHRAINWIKAYVEEIDPFEPLGTERTLSIKTELLNVSGRIDRIDQREIDGVEELVIVDYKTGRHDLAEGEAASSMPLAIYASMAERTFRQSCVQVELHHIPTGEIQIHRHSKESLTRQISRATDIALEARGAEKALADRPTESDDIFPARPSSLCGYCDYALLCEARTTPIVSPWAGIDLE